MMGARTGYTDQVARRITFEKAHPEVEIVCLRPAWQAVIPTENGQTILTRYDLRPLLDALDVLYPPVE
jgi:hypothetical protein